MENYLDKEQMYENYKKNIVTTIAYLIGVRDEILNSDFKEEMVKELEKNENAKIIRALSILRIEFIRNYKEITNRNNNLEPLETLTDLISVDLIKYLRKQGIEIIHINTNIAIHIAYINQHILENIEAIKNLIPSWVRWDYIKSIFLMPNCYSGVKGSALQNQSQAKKVVIQINLVRKHIGGYSSFYPYGTYLNWSSDKIKSYYGNILYNDAKFLKILYSSFDDTFRAIEYVVDATIEEKYSIYDFIDSSTNISILVDCENVDPYRFASVFKNLEEDNLKKIRKVLLYDDVHTSVAWDYMKELIDLPIEHQIITRVLDNKSLVDITMTAGACKEHYKENTESFILASSDSDFWGLIRSLPSARFYILNESDKTSEVILNKLTEENINYCFMDSFAQSEIQDFKNTVLLNCLKEKLEEFNNTGSFITIDAKELVSIIFEECHIMASYNQIEAEKEAFYEKYIKKGLKLVIVEDDESSYIQMELRK